MPLDLAPPPKLILPSREIITRPAILRAVDPWKVSVNDAMKAKGIDRSVRRAVVSAISVALRDEKAKDLRSALEDIGAWGAKRDQKLGLLVPGLGGVLAGLRQVDFAVFFKRTVGDAANLATYSFSESTAGIDGPNFIAVVLGGVGMTSNRTIDSCSAAGISLSLLDTAETGTNNRTFCHSGAGAPSGSVLLTFTLSGSCTRALACLFYAHGPVAPGTNGDSASSGSDTSKSVFVNVAAGGYVVAFAIASTATPTWTGVTKVEDTGDVESTNYGVAAMAGPLSANASYEVNCNTCRNLSAVAINPS